MSAPAAPSESQQNGLPFALAAYGIWGFVPLFFKLLASVPPVEVLAPVSTVERDLVAEASTV